MTEKGTVLEWEEEKRSQARIFATVAAVRKVRKVGRIYTLSFITLSRNQKFCPMTLSLQKRKGLKNRSFLLIRLNIMR